jgi:hypothetical protein
MNHEKRRTRRDRPVHGRSPDLASCYVEFGPAATCRDVCSMSAIGGQPGKLVLEPCNLRFRYRLAAKIGGLKLRQVQVPRNVLLDPFKTPPQLRFSEVPVVH